MSLFDAIVIGSGPAGVFAAYALRGKRVLVLDVGHQPASSAELDGNLFELRQRQPDLFRPLIGENFESLHNLHSRTISLKLKSPFLSYIVKDSDNFAPVSSRNFEAVSSFAQGGLASAWGAGVYRFTDRDLDSFPIRAADLEPYYDELTRHIGVSGASDDLDPYVGSDADLQEPIRLSRFAADLLQRYHSSRDYFQQRRIFIGRPRLAVLTRRHRDRDPYRYNNLEFFKPHDPAIYNPAYTLREMASEGAIEYKPGYLALRYAEREDAVEATARNLSTGEIETFRAKTLLLAAGTLNSTKLVLESNGDYDSRLPILDNPMSCIPLFRWDRIGAAIETHDGSLGQLNLVYDGSETLQATLYGTTGPLRSDVIFNFPLTVSANLAWTKYLAPAMGLLMVFYPGKHRASNYIKLNRTGELEINYETDPLGEAEERLIRAFHRIGYLSAKSLCQYPKMGASLHYAATLPMQRQPERYQTDTQGLLSGSKRVYVVDGACFTALPAKNLTFTIMANAMRIASGLRGALA